MSNKQKGFTLIELVVVITILGILAAFALPRFTNLETQARIAAVNGMAGSLRAAAALAHAQWLVEGATTGGTTINMEGATVDLTTDGYPSITANGIVNALQDTSGYDVTTTVGTFSLRANCAAIYDTSGPGNTPQVTTTISGC